MENKLFGKFFKLSLLVIFLIEFLSFWSWQSEVMMLVSFVLIALAVLVWSFIKLEYGFYLLLGELFIGSKGYLFSLEIFNQNMSVRMVLFVLMFLVWGIYLIKKRKLEIVNSSFSIYYVLLLIVVSLGIVSGVLNNLPLNVFKDANAWLYLLLFGLFFTVLKNSEIIYRAISLLLAAGFYLGLKTVFSLVAFSYNLPINLEIFYKWLRNTGVGEITYISDSFYRIFFQAHLYAMIAMIFCLVFLLLKENTKKEKIWLGLIYFLTSLAILISLSRSFWVAVLGSLFILLLVFIFSYRFKFKKIFKVGLIIILVTAVQILLLNVLFYGAFGPSGANRLISPETEAASSSRINQLRPLGDAIMERPLFGHGFGKTVTYISNDPRVKADNPDGLYTTYAFEWGYLDIILKLGLAGGLIYALFMFKLFKLGLRKKNYLSLALTMGLIALILTNIFSPYLNHPLGFGYLMLVAAILTYIIYDEQSAQADN